MPLSNPIQGEELVEAAKRAIAETVADGDDIDIHEALINGFDWITPEQADRMIEAAARAIIPVVLEQAAGVAEGMMSLYPHKSRASDATSDFDKGAQQALYLSAQAIRSLASQGREG